MYFSSNIKFLRKRKGLSQLQVAEQIDLPRSTLSGYENNISEPNYSLLIQFSEFFNINTDALLKEHLELLTESKLQLLEEQHDIQGKQLRVLAITVDAQNGEENIELVPEKAKAGYTTGYSDPEFVGVLSKFQLPFLGKIGTFRTFQISGDSMPPLKDGYWVTGKYSDDWTIIKNGTPCIVLTKSEGIVFKLLYNKLKERGEIMLVSTNTQYEPYIVHSSDILEIWTFVHSINSEFER